MATITFTKGHGTGNDFVLFSDPDGEIDLILPTQRSLELIARFDRVDTLLAELREASCPT